jgi:hypothetical protein
MNYGSNVFSLGSPTSPSNANKITVAGAVCVAGLVGLAVGSFSVYWYTRPISEHQQQQQSLQSRKNTNLTSSDLSGKSIDNAIISSYGKLVGNTPMVKLEVLSRALGCDIYAKVGGYPCLMYCWSTGFFFI